MSTERKPSVSTWFSSLRRQPKPKKLLTSKKHLQKSCVDLSSISNDVKSLPASVTNSPKLKNGFFRDNYFCLSPLKSLANGTKSNSLDSNERPKSPQPPPIASLKSRTHSITSNRSNGSSSSSSNESNNGQTITTITKVTKTTMITTAASLSATNNRINRTGTIFDDDNGQLITNLDVYKNYANSFRSNIIKNDSTSSCSSVSNNNNVPQSTTIRFDDTITNKYHADTDVTKKGNTTYISSVRDDVSSTSRINRQPFKSSSLNLDDDIEFIDTSSSLSDIGGSCGTFGSLENTSMYFNTLPKLPKSCISCKTQQQQSSKSKSDWNISVHRKVRSLFNI